MVLAVSDPPEIRNLGSKAPITEYADIASFALIEAFFVGMAIFLLSGGTRAFSTKVTERGIRQLRPLLFRRVWISYSAVTALR